MVSTWTVCAASSPLTSMPHHRQISSDSFFNPIRPLPAKWALPSRSNGRMSVANASLKEKAVAGLTAATLTAVMVFPDIAEAAQPGFSPSLKNFLLSIAAGGVVLTAIIGAVIGVANFDPVKRS
ncbi:uncharacterized protein LOC131251693 [Magnolia sinica]|uniref:uncharacterized protein LOC131251693 n=1 Tax=Magnolia sinica TaxID=86752 RepID=UPI0026595698|nr:uncharacterized protein LOC131251693 [Magnolia sinica]